MADADVPAPRTVRAAVTIRRSEQEVRDALQSFEWTAFDPRRALEQGGVRIVAAPGDRGVEVHAAVERDRGVARVATTLGGRSRAQRLHDEMRRFKSVLETGTLARSETSPEGPSSIRQLLHKRAAQPPARVA
jgi:uncharacterized membrane protein